MIKSNNKTSAKKLRYKATKKTTKYAVLSFMTAAIMTCQLTTNQLRAGGSHVSNIQQHSFLKNLVLRSDLIFKGKLMSINQGQSIEEIPYTFVTYKIDEIIAGTYSKNTITLKFVGGEFPNGNRLTATNTPQVKLGEESILMVQQSRNTGCDFVECEHGRFVLDQGKIIAANESAIIVDSKGGIDFVSLAARKKGLYKSSLEKPNVTGFIAHLKKIDQNTLTLRKSNRTMVKDTDKSTPFNAYPALTQAIKAPKVPKHKLQNKNNPNQLKGNPHDQWELEQLKSNGGNPVLKTSYSKAQD